MAFDRNVELIVDLQDIVVDKLMKKGYDGEYYSELDECIDCDY